MSEAIVCPVCDTYNPHDATHCEVCGERLTPPQPGEEVSPEENVASMIADEMPVGDGVEETPLPEDEPAGEDPAAAELDAEFAELESGEGDLEEATAADEAPGELVSDETELDAHADEAPSGEAADDVAAEEEQEAAASDEEPEYLYSPADGTAYPRGSEEYEDGFGPMGEELVAEPPQELTPIDADETESSEEGSAGFDHEYDDRADGGFEKGVAPGPPEEGDGQPFTREPSAQFEAAFQKRERERPVMEPLPSPGTLAQPATLTLYVNREPVHTHPIDTDEVLIGRRDPVADAYPDLDLTEFDPKSEVSRKHAYVYRQNKNHTLYVVSNAGTQLNSELLEIGDRRPLDDGDVMVLSGKFAIKFDIPEQE